MILSEGFVAFARHKVTDGRARFQLGDAQALPVPNASFDATVTRLHGSSSTQNKAAAEMTRATRPGGVVAGYVWDYAGEMQMMRQFWDAAVALDTAAIALDGRSPISYLSPGAVGHTFWGVGLDGVQVRPIDVPTVFKDFDDYLSPV